MNTGPIPFPVDMNQKPDITHFFDPQSNTFSYIVKDPESSACAVIDSVLDIDYAAGRLSYSGADALICFIQDNQLKLEWIIETHVHADHLSAAPYIQAQLGGKIGISSHIHVVQKTFGKVFNEGTEFKRDGTQFDHLFEDG
ncbi:MAG: MBL fold metallo-hydrolase, partial [Limnobacter sp.]|nr:MBL fold metallo-hydrolase [Limnobacter sp.]